MGSTPVKHQSKQNGIEQPLQGKNNIQRQLHVEVKNEENLDKERVDELRNPTSPTKELLKDSHDEGLEKKADTQTQEKIFREERIPKVDEDRDLSESEKQKSTLPTEDQPSDENGEQKTECTEFVKNVQQTNTDIPSGDVDIQVPCSQNAYVSKADDNANKVEDNKDKVEDNSDKVEDKVEDNSNIVEDNSDRSDGNLIRVLAQTPGLTDKLFHNNQAYKVASILIKLLVEVNDTKQSSCNTEEDLHSLVCDLQKAMSQRDESYKSGNQNDCHSLFLCLMEALDEENKGCTSLFEGHTRNIFRYSTCEHVEECPSECIRSLLLTVDDVCCSVEDSLKLLEEIVTFDNAEVPCRACLGEEKHYEDTSTYKQFIIEKPPEILVLQLARFKQDMLPVNGPHRRLYKYQGNVHYPPTLSLPTSIEGPSGRECVHIWYELYGVICHEGSLEEGHYWCYVKKNGWNPDNLYLWHLCADSYVRRLDINEEWPNSPFAYLLFYKRLKL